MTGMFEEVMTTMMVTAGVEANGGTMAVVAGAAAMLWRTATSATSVATDTRESAPFPGQCAGTTRRRGTTRETTPGRKVEAAPPRERQGGGRVFMFRAEDALEDPVEGNVLLTCGSLFVLFCLFYSRGRVALCCCYGCCRSAR